MGASFPVMKPFFPVMEPCGKLFWVILRAIAIPNMSNPISVLLVEDEAIWAKQLQVHIRNLGYEVAATFNDAADAMASMESLTFDIVLLDIRMHGKNTGIALAKLVHAVYHKPFIFITGSTEKETIAEAVAAKPSAYLIKPVSEASLFAAIQTALDNFNEQKAADFQVSNMVNDDYFFVKTGTSYKRIEWKEVAALSVEGRYSKVVLHNDNDAYLISNSLSKTITTIVPPSFRPVFVQVNRNDVVNIQYIKELKGSMVRTAMHHFPVSEMYMKGLRERLNIVS